MSPPLAGRMSAPQCRPVKSPRDGEGARRDALGMRARRRAGVTASGARGSAAVGHQATSATRRLPLSW